MARTYVILNASEVSSVDFNKVLETSEDTLRWSVDGWQTFVKFEGATPNFLEGKTQLTHTEIRAILSGPDWTQPNEQE
jgi:hypothetical protein